MLASAGAPCDLSAKGRAPTAAADPGFTVALGTRRCLDAKRRAAPAVCDDHAERLGAFGEGVLLFCSRLDGLRSHLATLVSLAHPCALFPAESARHSEEGGLRVTLRGQGGA